MADRTLAITCPDCGTHQVASAPRYFAVAKNPNLKDELLAGRLGCHKCNNCDFRGVVANPLIYHDPSFGLATFVCDEDRETLLDEFHAFLEECRDEMDEAEYRSILTGPFQIVVGMHTLARMVFALDNDIHCYRMTPGLTETPTFDSMFLLTAAKHYRLAEQHEKAYEVMNRGKKYFYSCPNFLREFGAYAYSAGHLEEAEEALVRSDEILEKRSHIWVQIVPAEGPVTSIPDEVGLPKFASRMRSIYESMRPELSLSDDESAALAGILLGTIEETVSNFGQSWELSLDKEYLNLRLNGFLKDKPADEKTRLETILERAFMECHH